MRPTEFSAVSEDTLLASWTLAEGEHPTPELANLLGRLTRHLLEQHADVVVNVVPAYQTLMVQFDILVSNHETVEQLIRTGLDQVLSIHESETDGSLHTIPVFYDPRVGPDSANLCHEKGISLSALVNHHTQQIYTVYAVGFQPGFAYLGYVDEKIAMPRLASFRSHVPAGSVGIADQQTAVYPADSAGGWQIIGRTPISLLSNSRNLLNTGDRVQFKAIDESEYLALGGSLEFADD